MDRALLTIGVIVAMVGVVGLITVMPQQQGGDLATGNVVKTAELSDKCATCEGSPVCAAKDGRAKNYENACAAECDHARVIYDAVCERIPRANPQLSSE